MKIGSPLWKFKTRLRRNPRLLLAPLLLLLVLLLGSFAVKAAHGLAAAAAMLWITVGVAVGFLLGRITTPKPFPRKKTR
ncbi:hypothetical protein [Tumebacillus flagellatus]|uniref:Uncharacterized protein n=1 Tax=Tumebacillus flagellatus TaxID=1157490 RepID=A0A074LL91_9BACL|nr:hypothetical protein [Tumebacillus flagellatus]KEO82906.1 hypothetical protein EL26_12475 [Tumebacillus flagellatus]